VTGKAAQFNDLPELQEDEVMPSPAESADPLTPLVKKTRSRKKVETPKESASQEMVAQDTEIVPNLVDPPKRRRKKADAPPMEDPESRATTTSSTSTETASELIDAKSSVTSPKPKRTRRIGEPKPKRYAVGEPKAEHNL
jgi:hypothetical protein